ncbi:MAG: DNA-deoxyinosine glycosylase [Campylobacterota bacterium]|nr:DNA-deoxyinosine glycosylase [Campylobacterota bacterium]
MILHHPFEPIIDKESKILILGSFPSIASFEHNFYYAHPRNQFWKIMAALFDVELLHVEAKKAFCHQYHIALWDAYGSLKREAGNSSDANLSETVVNPIDKLLEKYPNITAVFCNGGKSYDAVRKNFKTLNIIKLPSSSPAYAALSFEKKLEAYETLKERLETC